MLQTVNREIKEGNIAKAVKDIELQERPLVLNNLPRFAEAHRFNQENVALTDTLVRRRLKTNSLVTTSYIGSLIQTLKDAISGEQAHIIRDLHHLNDTVLRTEADIEEMDLGHEEFMVTYALLGLLAIMLLIQGFLLWIFKTSAVNAITKVLAKYNLQCMGEEMVPLTTSFGKGQGSAPPYLPPM